MITVDNEYLDIRKTADSGQIFRFNKTGEAEYTAIAGDRLLKIRTGDGIKFDCSKKEYDSFWKHYFDMETDYSRFSDNIPTDDLFLLQAAEYSKGIRILNQDPWEMLISFIISQRKSIPAIKSSIEKLSMMFGREIAADTYAFPEPEMLAAADPDKLKACSLGYRDEYVYKAAVQVSDGIIDLESMKKLDDESLKQELLKIRGVGEKVANCVMLFGFHRIGAFPIDVWIRKMIDEHYDGSFPLDRYEGYAGIIQQYIFFYGREMAKIR